MNNTTHRTAKLQGDATEKQDCRKCVENAESFHAVFYITKRIFTPV